MGLDMYLSKKTYVKNWKHNKDKWNVRVAYNGRKSHIKPERVCYVEEEIAYWRKANHIHAWFVQNVQNGVDECQHSYVDRKKLRELVDLCKKVLQYPEAAPALLPTQSGFFFGGTGYDDFYMEDLRETIKMIEPELEREEVGHGSDFYYHASW